MRHRPETDTDEPKEAKTEEREKDEESGRRRIDLSVAQVSGSALAAVIAAKLASTLGVYGTIIGAGVISVIATCGGPLFQYVFRRTGEQVRDATAAARPRGRQVPLAAGAAPGAGPARDDATLLLAAVPPPLPEREEFGEATTHGTRVRGWKRPAIAAALVFGVTMGGITTYELVAGEDFSGRQGTTTFGSAVRGGGHGGQDAPDPGGETTPTPSGSSDGTGRPGDGTTSGPGPAPSSGDRDSGRPDTGQDGSGTPSAEPTPSAPTDGGTTPPPEPTGPTTGPTAPTLEPSTGTGPTGVPTAPSFPAPTGPDTGTGAEPGAE
ncbi:MULTISPECIES: hypothetical protein [unclassified Streptomyces]|uniref:hypothetical protein n=1 Tax=unclassified Streptomyces TaxID=2593676 RepID=UPI00099D5DBE|nr:MULTISPECIES: hypothetical protein [unclassified Streptomyces]